MSVKLTHPESGELVLATEAGAKVLRKEHGYTDYEAPSPEEGDGLDKLKRADLNKLAAELEIEDPDELPNIDAVIAAIREKRAEAE